MLKLAAILLVVGLTSANFVVESEFNDEFQLWKNTFKREYKTAQDEIYRFAVWLNNLRIVNQHNLEAALGMHSYTLAVNEYSDMTSEQVKNNMNGFLGHIPKNRSGDFHMLGFGQFPDSVDWRDKGYVTPVKNQGQCGSCWSFSSTGSLEGQHFKASGKLVDLSEQNLVDCSISYGNHGCEGGLMDYAFQYVKDNGGLDTEDSYPYEAEDDSCRFKKNDIGATDSGFVDVPDSEDALKQAVATVGPISVAIDASHPSFQMYNQGVYVEQDCSQTELDHGVLVVGYGTEDGQDYWLVKNSWGESWGQKGYIKMARNLNNQCGIASSASYPTVTKTE